MPVTGITEMQCECGGLPSCDKTIDVTDELWDSLGPIATRPAIRSPNCTNRLLGDEYEISRNESCRLIGKREGEEE